MTTKTCSKCSIVKSLSDFYRNRSANDGRATYCVPCWKSYNHDQFVKRREERKAKQREWYSENAEHARAWRKKYYKLHRRDPRFIATANKVAREWQRANRWSLRNCACKAVALAVRCGALKRLPCEVCGVQPADGHHPKGYDLANWFTLQWLCPKHHNDAHGRETHD